MLLEDINATLLTDIFVHDKLFTHLRATDFKWCRVHGCLCHEGGSESYKTEAARFSRRSVTHNLKDVISIDEESANELRAASRIT